MTMPEMLSMKEFKLAGPEAFDLSPGFRVIEAGAGSGKTYSLTYLVLRLVVERGFGIDEVLMVTFTEAAALELRQRMRELFEDVAGGKLERFKARTGEFALADGSPNPKAVEAFADSAADLGIILCQEDREEYGRRRKLLDMALLRMGGMTITTIHGFCQMAMAEHSVNAGFEPTEGVPVDAKEIAEAIALDYLRVFPAFNQAKSSAPKLSEVAKAVRLRLGDPQCVINEVVMKGRAGSKVPAPVKFPQLEEFIHKRRALDPTVTFDDLILNFERRLTDVADARSAKLTKLVRERYRACFIDESQDNDAHQWAVFRHLFVASLDAAGVKVPAEGKLLVMVGDPKQAIYGFRGADVRTYSHAVRSAQAPNVYSLPYNFRSTPLMIRGFNALFALEDRGRGENFFGFKTPADGASTGIHYSLAKSKKPKEELPGKPIWVVPGYRPTQVAREVRRQLDSLKPGQTIGVLVRSNADADEVHRALVEKGVAAALESTQSVFDTRAAYLASLLLAAVLKPEDTGLRRALFLARPALFWPPASPDDGRDSHPDGPSPAIRGLGSSSLDQQAQADLAAWLADCRTAWLKRGFPACWEMLSNTKPRSKKSLLVGVEEKSRLISVLESLGYSLFRSRLLIDWRHLGELLAERQASRKLDPHQLVRYLSLRVKEDVPADEDASLAESLRPESERPQVVVQTYHKSKGLEYDIVIMLNKSGKGADSSPNKPGTVIKTAGNATGVLYAGTVHDDDFRMQDRQEAARLLYVAITRAKRRVVVLSPHDQFTVKQSKKGAAREYYGFFGVLWSLGLNPHTLSFEPTHPDIAGADKEHQAVHEAAAQLLAQVLQPETPAPDFPKVAPAPSRSDDGLGFKVYTAARSRSEEDDGAVAPDQSTAPKLNQTVYHARGSTSFSGLSKGRHDEGDGHFDGTNRENKSEESGKDLRLPEQLKGAYFGTFMHELLEDLDFAKAASPGDPEVRQFVEERLERSGLVARGAPDGRFEATLTQLCDSLHLWMTLPLVPRVPGAHAPFRLADVAPEQKLNEVRFALKAKWGYAADDSGHKADLLAAAFKRHYQVEGQDGPLSQLKLGKDRTLGLLIGTIDLAFAHGGVGGAGDRFFVVDWKTNHLGGKPEDYAVKGLNAGIVGNLYHAQYVFYVAALDLYLGQVLGREGWCYDFRLAKPGQASFGGVYYLFLRGFGSAPSSQPGLGVHYDLPPYGLIQEVQQILGGEIK